MALTMNSLPQSERKRWTSKIEMYNKNLKGLRARVKAASSPRSASPSSPSSSSSSSSSSSRSASPVSPSSSRPRSGSHSEEEKELLADYKALHSDTMKLKEAAAVARDTSAMAADTLSELHRQGERMTGWRHTVRTAPLIFSFHNLRLFSPLLHYLPFPSTKY
jgi:hypothetical protein